MLTAVQLEYQFQNQRAFEAAALRKVIIMICTVTMTIGTSINEGNLRLVLR